MQSGINEAFSRYKELDELATDIQILTGRNLEELKAMLMAGWRLMPPEDLMSASKSLDDILGGIKK